METLVIVIAVIVAMCVCIAANIVCFVIGARVGQKVSKGETIVMPTPMQAVRERKERKEAQMEQDRFNTIMSNIEKYDGTGKGQEDVG